MSFDDSVRARRAWRSLENYLWSFNINPYSVLRDDISVHGYYELQRGADGVLVRDSFGDLVTVFRLWPERFDVRFFAGLWDDYFAE